MNKNLVLLLGLSMTLVSTSCFASSDTSPVIACTMEYAPVCGKMSVQCITAPCLPAEQTFGNACMAKAAGATDIIPGECGQSNT